MSNMYDLIIIGGGPAAVSAGIYAARKRIKALVIAGRLGGEIFKAPLVENYPGIKSITGFDLANRFVEHLKNNKVEIKEGIKIEKIGMDGEKVVAKNNENEFQSKAVIIATGQSPKKLGFPDEDKYIGKGIGYCATCDAPLFADKTVAVVGGGNSGISTALDLANYAKKVYILSSSKKADQFLYERVDKAPKVNIIHNVRATGFEAEEFVKGIIYTDKKTGKKTKLAIDGFFVSVGWTPNSNLVKDMVELNEWEEIKVDSENKTSNERVFAAGDVTNVPHKQIVVAAGEGAKAALSAHEFLTSLSSPRKRGSRS